jgi:hypothetical protein
MSESNPTAPGKPVKPYPEFPLSLHPAGCWCKKIRGKVHYFGPRWRDAAVAVTDAALTDNLQQKDALHACRGRPRTNGPSRNW